MSTLRVRLDEWSATVLRCEGARDAAQRDLDHQQDELAILTEDKDRTDKAHRVLQAAASALRDRMRGALEQVGAVMLRVVFDDPTYSVEFKIDVKRGRVYAEAWVTRGDISAPVLEGHGGGVADVLAFAFRVAVVRSMAVPQIVIADEPFKFVNTPTALNRLKRVFSDLAASGLQLLVVSSRDDMLDTPGARVFRFEHGDEGTSVECLT